MRNLTRPTCLIKSLPIVTDLFQGPPRSVRLPSSGRGRGPLDRWGLTQHEITYAAQQLFVAPRQPVRLRPLHSVPLCTCLRCLTETHFPQWRRTSFVTLDSFSCPWNQNAAVDYFYSATSRRYRGAMWSIFTLAFIPPPVIVRLELRVLKIKRGDSAPPCELRNGEVTANVGNIRDQRWMSRETQVLIAHEA
jgi:hypothetical protein